MLDLNPALQEDTPLVVIQCTLVIKPIRVGDVLCVLQDNRVLQSMVAEVDPFITIML